MDMIMLSISYEEMLELFKQNARDPVEMDVSCDGNRFNLEIPIKSTPGAFIPVSLDFTLSDGLFRIYFGSGPIRSIAYLSFTLNELLEFIKGNMKKVPEALNFIKPGSSDDTVRLRLKPELEFLATLSRTTVTEAEGLRLHLNPG